MKEGEIIYFKGLNGIRAIASIIVVIWHVDQYSALFNIESKGFCLNGMATRAVDLFFVLSGFLITFLLLKEKEQYGKIDLKKFYLRRILRIWPIYYLVVLIAFLIYFFNILTPENSLIISAFFYLFFLANIAFSTGYDLKAITPLWSVGVEEQFYLFWPIIISKLKKYEFFFIIIFISGAVIRVFFSFFIFNKNLDFIHFLYNFKINIMSLGALGAYWIYNSSKYLNLIYRKDIQIVSWSVLLISIFYKPLHVLSVFDSELNSIFYFVIILNVSNNKNTLITLENEMFKFFGKISYGVYIYHMLLIHVLSIIVKKIDIKFNYFSLQFFILIITIFISWFSYIYFEKYFLKKKNNYMKIKSTNSLNDD